MSIEMFEKFECEFVVDPEHHDESAAEIPHYDVPGLRELISRFGGRSFMQGLYRVTRASDMPIWHRRIAAAFPEFRGRILWCFGFDWLGRAFALERDRLEQGQPGVAMFEPGAGDVFEIPCNIETFHDNELVEYGTRDGAVASSSYKAWLQNGGPQPTYTQCIGYKIPLFLGGVDEFKNFELSDLDVYWELMGQLLGKTSGLPEGTKIRIDR